MGGETEAPRCYHLTQGGSWQVADEAGDLQPWRLSPRGGTEPGPGVRGHGCWTERPSRPCMPPEEIGGNPNWPPWVGRRGCQPRRKGCAHAFIQAFNECQLNPGHDGTLSGGPFKIPDRAEFLTGGRVRASPKAASLTDPRNFTEPLPLQSHQLHFTEKDTEALTRTVSGQRPQTPCF